MSKSLLLLSSGSAERSQIAALSTAMLDLGLRVVVEDLDSGDYQRILDAVEQTDTVVYWPASPLG